MTNPIQITIDHAAAVAPAGNLPAPLHRVCALDLVAATPWAIEPAMLDTIRSIATRQNDSVEALEARDGARLGSILRNHLREKGQAVLDGLRAERSRGPV